MFQADIKHSDQAKLIYVRCFTLMKVKIDARMSHTIFEKIKIKIKESPNFGQRAAVALEPMQ